MLQGRASVGGKWTSPNRDITYLFPTMARDAFEEFEQLRPFVTEICEKFNLKDEEICEVAKQLAEFIRNVHGDKVIHAPDGEVLDRISGLFLDFNDNAPLSARLVFSYFFLRHAAYHFACGVRAVTHEGENDAPDFSREIADLDCWEGRLTFWDKLRAIWRIIRR